MFNCNILVCSFFEKVVFVVYCIKQQKVEIKFLFYNKYITLAY